MPNKVVDYGCRGLIYGAASGLTAATVIAVYAGYIMVEDIKNQPCLKNNEPGCGIVVPIMTGAMLYLYFQMMPLIGGAYIVTGTIAGGALGAGIGLVQEGYTFFTQPKNLLPNEVEFDLDADQQNKIK